ncbi:MAG: hypothetical protein EXR61_04845 [Chloroflexi bacterium]|nr:hypothetical protein [Chloroflexota bacterium]
MRTLFDHHVHTDRSDGRVSLADRGTTATSHRHGVSDHFPYRGSLESDDDVLRYQDDAARLGLRVGIEYDLGVAPRLLPLTRSTLDYVIGSVHQVHQRGERIGYDRAGAFLQGRGAGIYPERQRFAADQDLQRHVLEQHLRLIAEGIEQIGIDIVGHPTFTPLAALGDPETGYPVEWQHRLIALCLAGDVAIEVNETYGVPHHEFLVRARTAGVRFSVGSDAHGPLTDLARTEAMIDAAMLPRDRFLDGCRVRLPR